MRRRRSGRPEAESVKQFRRVDLQQLVSLAPERQHGVGPKPHVTVHTRSEVNAKERKVWVRHLTDTYIHTDTDTFRDIYGQIHRVTQKRTSSPMCSNNKVLTIGIG